MWGFPPPQTSFITDIPSPICHPEPRVHQRGREPPREGPMYFVYIMTNCSKTLYVGVTNNLMGRVREHKTGIGSAFTTKYKLDRLVDFQRFEYVHNAIEREKCIKGWLRIKKIGLIVSTNPGWKDLSEEWYERHQYQPQSASVPLPSSWRKQPKAQRGGASLPRLRFSSTYAAGINFFIRSFISWGDTSST